MCSLYSLLSLSQVNFLKDLFNMLKNIYGGRRRRRRSSSHYFDKSICYSNLLHWNIQSNPISTWYILNSTILAVAKKYIMHVDKWIKFIVSFASLLCVSGQRCKTYFIIFMALCAEMVHSLVMWVDVDWIGLVGG